MNPEFRTEISVLALALSDVVHLHSPSAAAAVVVVIFELFIYFPGETDCVSLCEVLQCSRYERSEGTLRQSSVVGPVRYSIRTVTTNMYCTLSCQVPLKVQFSSRQIM